MAFFLNKGKICGEKTKCCEMVYLLVKNCLESLLEAFKNGWTKYRNSLVELTEGREWIFQKSSKHRKSQQQWVKHWCSWKTSGAVKQRPNNTGGLPEKNNRGR
jgi:hypothetical protein